jgi:hypothetical protein
MIRRKFWRQGAEETLMQIYHESVLSQSARLLSANPVISAGFIEICRPRHVFNLLRYVCVNQSELSLGKRKVGNAWTYGVNGATNDSCKIALGHRFSPTRDLRREALVKRSATMPLFYHSLVVAR